MLTPKERLLGQVVSTVSSSTHAAKVKPEDEDGEGGGVPIGQRMRKDDIEFIDESGASFTFSYMHYDGMESSAPDYSRIVVHFATGHGRFVVTIEGDGLAGLHSQIKARIARPIMPVDPLHAKADGAQFAVESVRVALVKEG